MIDTFLRFSVWKKNCAKCKDNFQKAKPYDHSIRGREGSGFLDFHLLVTTNWIAFTGFGTENLCPTYRATISLAKLTHRSLPPINAKG